GRQATFARRPANACNPGRAGRAGPPGTDGARCKRPPANSVLTAMRVAEIATLAVAFARYFAQLASVLAGVTHREEATRSLRELGANAGVLRAGLSADAAHAAEAASAGLTAA